MDLNVGSPDDGALFDIMVLLYPIKTSRGTWA